MFSVKDSDMFSLDVLLKHVIISLLMKTNSTNQNCLRDSKFSDTRYALSNPFGQDS